MTTPPHIDPETIREFTAWRAPWVTDRPMNLWDYIFHESSVGLAAAHATMFWPEFAEFDGCVLLADRGSTEYVAYWMQGLDGDRGRVEAMINHVHLYYRFRKGIEEEGADAALRYFGEVLQRTWSATLREAYPDRTFIVSYDSDEQYGDPTITFWQVRDESVMHS